MKKNKIEHSGKTRAIVIASTVLVGLAVVGLAVGYKTLRDIWLEQCVINDPSVQVTVSQGTMVKADVVAELFGLKKGANLGLIDFEAKRAEVLEKIPNLRAVTISRQLPDKVTITTEERTPVARMNVRGRKSETGHVVDTEGVVFIWQRGTQSLPVIREAQSPGTAVGQRLTGRALAALRLLESSREAERADLGILEADVSKPDYILATLGNYSQAKIAWEGMNEPNASNQKNLDRQLTRLAKAIRTGVGTTTVIWNATDTLSPGRVYADTKGNL